MCVRLRVPVVCVMGLKSAKYGVKSELRARFPQAFREFESLVDARDASMATREEAFVCLDGNVLMRSVGQSVATFDGYVAVLTASLKRVLATALVTVVVFDEPESITEAKQEEQAKRDAARASTAIACSTDLAAAPSNDDYNQRCLEAVLDVSPLVNNRATRSRFFDACAMHILKYLKGQIARWNGSGFAGGHVFFDGVDARGADRPIGQPRAPSVVGDCERVAALLAREVAIGEGDLKLAELGRRARQLAAAGEPGFKAVKLAMVTTIDTDSFAIELIEEAKRENCSDKPPVHTLLCMRERARKRGANDDKKSYYLCCDVTLLHALLQRHMWGVSRQPTDVEQRAAMTLMAAGWALSGCDFLELKGMRSDAVIDSLPIVAKTIPAAIENVTSSWSGNRDDQHFVHQAIRALAVTCASKLLEIPRIKKDCVPSIRDPDEAVLKRAAWVASYWNSVELRGDMRQFGFLGASSG